MNSIDALAMFSARYSHHRQTGASLVVVRELKGSWGSISDDVKAKIIQESYEASENLSDWEDLRQWAIDN